jgi:hypothetical protein
LPYSSYSALNPQLHTKYGNNPWYGSPFGYLFHRYRQIEGRVVETSRYVEIESDNKGTFSYEFGSILRDIGSAFSSVMDCLVDNTSRNHQDEYTIDDYTRLLIDEVEDVSLIGLVLTIPFKNNFLLPFEGIIANTPPRTKLPWWQPYTKLKHSEIAYHKSGCLSNVIDGIATLAILYLLMDPHRRLLRESRLFYQGCGYYQPLDQAKKALF